MSKPYCIKCKVFFSDNRIQGRNICRPCNYQQQKEINDKKNAGLTEKKCDACNISKLLKEFPSKAHKKCRHCTEVEQSSLLVDKYCTKCNLLLTESNRSPGTSQCRPCVNKRKREYKLKKIQHPKE